MTISDCIRRLNEGGEILKTLLKTFDRKDALYRPAPGKWNMLEIACHLLDEERYDFRVRVKHIAEKAAGDPPPIDPEGWVLSHDYAGKDYETVTEDFISERNISLQWLRTLNEEQLGNTFTHKLLGEVTARFFLVNWIAHDYLHIRQITFLKYSKLRQDSETELAYAGDWN